MENKMPRKARKNFNSNYYHVIVQGINKEYIFNNNHQIKEYKRILLKKLKDSQITILAYCIMNNHAHLLIYAENVLALSKYMQKVNLSYSQRYNKMNNRVGYVFRDRYYTEEILDKRQLFNCIRYIHNNPVKAKMVNNCGEYPYSSYLEYCNSKMELINNKSLDILFNGNKNYKKEFYNMHFQSKIEEDFFDIKEKSIEDLIKETEDKYNKNILEFKENKEVMIEFLKEARKQSDVTIVELSDILKISKSCVWNYLKK